MCARYELTATPRMIMERFRLETAPPMPNKQAIRPTDLALVIDGAGARLLPWGLSVSWSTRPLINARAESLADKPTFRPLLDKRCLVPMSAYFEWRTDENGQKHKNRIAAVDEDRGDGLRAFAGLTDGAAFTIATCEPAPGIERIHDRMPVILDADAALAWADAEKSYAEVADMLTPFAGAITYEEETPERNPEGNQGELF